MVLKEANCVKTKRVLKEPNGPIITQFTMTKYGLERSQFIFGCVGLSSKGLERTYCS